MQRTELADGTAPRLVDHVARNARNLARTALWLGALLLLSADGVK